MNAHPPRKLDQVKEFLRAIAKSQNLDNPDFHSLAQKINAGFERLAISNRIFAGQGAFKVTAGTLKSLPLSIHAVSEILQFPIAVTVSDTRNTRPRNSRICGYVVTPEMANGIERNPLEGEPDPRETRLKSEGLFEEIYTLQEECVRHNTCVDIIKTQEGPPISVFVSPEIFKDIIKPKLAGARPSPGPESGPNEAPAAAPQKRDAEPITAIVREFSQHRRTFLDRLEKNDTFGLIRSGRTREIVAVAVPESWVLALLRENPKLSAQKLSGTEQVNMTIQDYKNMNPDRPILAMNRSRTLGCTFHPDHLDRIQEYKNRPNLKAQQEETPITTEDPPQGSIQNPAGGTLPNKYNAKARQLNAFTTAVFNAAVMANNGTDTTTNLTSPQGSKAQITTLPDIIEQIKAAGAQITRPIPAADRENLAIAVGQSLTKAANKQDPKSSVIRITFQGAAGNISIREVGVRPDPYELALKEFDF